MLLTVSWVPFCSKYKILERYPYPYLSYFSPIFSLPLMYRPISRSYTTVSKPCFCFSTRFSLWFEKLEELHVFHRQPLSMPIKWSNRRIQIKYSIEWGIGVFSIANKWYWYQFFNWNWNPLTLISYISFLFMVIEFLELKLTRTIA